MTPKLRASVFLTFALGLVSTLVPAGDSLYGTVTAVKSGTIVTLDYGTGHYDIRIAGIEIPPAGGSSPAPTPAPVGKSAPLPARKTSTGPAKRTATAPVEKHRKHPPTPAPMDAKTFVENLVLHKNARIRLVRRISATELMSHLLTDDPDPRIGIRDVALELLKAGLVVRAAGDDRMYGYKYSELTVAESEARRNGVGIWAAAPAPTSTPLPPPPPPPTPTPTPIPDRIP